MNEKKVDTTPSKEIHHGKHEKKESKREIPLEQNNLWKITTSILAILLIISLVGNWDISITKTGESNPTAAAANPGNIKDPSPSPAAKLDPKDLYDADDPMIGDPNAPVTIVEFSDFECPFCARFHSDTLPSIMKNYIYTGKVNLVYRDFPLSFHPEATPSALAAECAQDQGKFWEFHDFIFENTNLLGDDSYYAWAEELNLDMDKFGECYESQEHLAEVQEDFREGGQLGVSGTPAFFVNGVLLTGAQPYSVFEAAIESSLS